VKLRYGEFPTHHAFLLVVRPLVDWTFKFTGWLFITATIRYGEKTGSQILWYVEWLLQLLLGLFVFNFIDWVTDFQFGPRKTPICGVSA
jgi:hypothetical protein